MFILASWLLHHLLPLEIYSKGERQRWREVESERESKMRKGGGIKRERSTSLHRRILSDCLDRLVEFKMQQGPVMWQ